MPSGVEYKISILDETSDAGGYKNVPVDLRDPRAAEPLVKFSDCGIACDSYEARSICGDDPYKEKISGAAKDVWGRKTVAEKLGRVNGFLRPWDMEIFVWDGYRSIEGQASFWNYYSRQTARQMPLFSEEERKKATLKLVSDPTGFDRSDSTTWPIHTSGGAVDVGMRSLKTGAFPDISAGFDEKGRIPQSDVLERKVLAGEISEDDPRLIYRRLLHWAMAEEGFINCPFEYWHFDYGDQMYVLYSHMLKMSDAPRAAWYGYVDSPESE